jgi:predicted DCC family thiol-disulfide oxidoreductase YuxK
MIAAPVLLFNGECAVCRSIARWVAASSTKGSGPARLSERPIGDDPAALLQINPALDIWDAYATIHLVMPDGTMKLGGEAVAEVLRRLPNCTWFSWLFDVGVAGVRPFQAILNLGYVVLADLRPILGCESCGIPSPWVKFIASLVKRVERPAHFSRSTER